MRMITGILNLICLALLLMKYPARKYHLNELNARLQLLHKPVSGLVCLTIGLHIGTILAVIRKVPAVIPVLGGLIVIVYLLLVTLCHTMKEHEQKMHWHRIMSVCLLAVIIGHAVSAVF